MTRYVVDASVVAKWHFGEDLSELADALLASARSGECRIAAPDLIIYEFGSIVLKKVRAGMIDARDGEDIIATFPRSPLMLTPATEMTSAALEVAQMTGASFYDSVYVASARDTGAVLVTADRKLIAQVRSSSLAPCVMDLAQIDLRR